MNSATRRPSPHACQSSQLEQVAAPADSHSTTSNTAHAAGTQRIPRARHASAPLLEPITPTRNGNAHTSAAEVPVVPRHVPAAGQPGQLGRVVTLADSKTTSADKARASFTQRLSTGHDRTAQHRQLAVLTPQSLAAQAYAQQQLLSHGAMSQLLTRSASLGRVLRLWLCGPQGQVGTAFPRAQQGRPSRRAILLLLQGQARFRWLPSQAGESLRICAINCHSALPQHETYTDLKHQHDVPFTFARMGRQSTCQHGQPLTERAWQGRGPWPISQGRPGSSGAPRGSRPRSARSRKDRRSTSAGRRR